jgi:hypothetical protein
MDAKIHDFLKEAGEERQEARGENTPSSCLPLLT